MVKTYDLTKVILTINGVPISGFQDGDAIRVAPDGADWEKTTGADGAVCRSAQNYPGGKITISLMYSSLANNVLSALRSLDRATGAAAGMLMVQDLNGGTQTVANGAWVEQAPEIVYGRTVGVLEWVIDAANVETTPMGIPGYDGRTI